MVISGIFGLPLLLLIGLLRVSQLNFVISRAKREAFVAEDAPSVGNRPT
jgi:hypothetical protein